MNRMMNNRRHAFSPGDVIVLSDSRARTVCIVASAEPVAGSATQSELTLVVAHKQGRVMARVTASSSDWRWILSGRKVRP